MHKLLSRFKPGAPRHIHLLSAALLWTVVGFILIVRGSIWLDDGKNLLFILPAILIGTLKSLFILDKSAEKSIDRILRLADGSCLGAVYSIKTWLLVVGMILLGYILRQTSIPLILLGTLYAAIGWALMFSSRAAWGAWLHLKNKGL